MGRVIGVGIQSFEKIRSWNCFYVDKTHFIKEWWERGDDVTLITKHRRFGKTLNMSMLECFFSNKYAGGGAIFLRGWRSGRMKRIGSCRERIRWFF